MTRLSLLPDLGGTRLCALPGVLAAAGKGPRSRCVLLSPRFWNFLRAPYVSEPLGMLEKLQRSRLLVARAWLGVRHAAPELDLNPLGMLDWILALRLDPSLMGAQRVGRSARNNR